MWAVGVWGLNKTPKTKPHSLSSGAAIKSLARKATTPNEKCLEKRKLYSQQ